MLKRLKAPRKTFSHLPSPEYRHHLVLIAIGSNRLLLMQLHGFGMYVSVNCCKDSRDGSTFTRRSEYNLAAQSRPVTNMYHADKASRISGQ